MFEQGRNAAIQYREKGGAIEIE